MATYQKRRGRWRALVRIAGHPARSKTFRTKTQAQLWAQKVEDGIREGSIPGREAQRTAVRQALDDYIAELPQKGLKTELEIQRQLEDWQKVLGEYSLASVTPALIAKQRNRLLKTLAPGTVNRRLAALSGFFKWCVRERQLLKVNPVSAVRKPAEPKGRVRYLSDDERERLFAACREDRCAYLLPLVVVATYTGLRQGELLALDWEDVDFKDKSLIVRDSKNREARRVPLRGPALDAVRSWGKLRAIGDQRVFGVRTFPKSAWQRALKESKVRDLRFHDLRHTAASYLVQSGANLADVAEVLGHKTLAVTRRYAHLSPKRVASVMDNMVEQFG